METNEIVGLAILGLVVFTATAQMAFAFGRQAQANMERKLADRRVRGVLASVNRNREVLQ